MKLTVFAMLDDESRVLVRVVGVLPLLMINLFNRTGLKLRKLSCEPARNADECFEDDWGGQIKQNVRFRRTVKQSCCRPRARKGIPEVWDQCSR